MRPHHANCRSNLKKICFSEIPRHRQCLTWDGSADLVRTAIPRRKGAPSISEAINCNAEVSSNSTDVCSRSLTCFSVHAHQFLCFRYQVAEHSQRCELPRREQVVVVGHAINGSLEVPRVVGKSSIRNVGRCWHMSYRVVT